MRGYGLGSCWNTKTVASGVGPLEGLKVERYKVGKQKRRREDTACRAPTREKAASSRPTPKSGLEAGATKSGAAGFPSAALRASGRDDRFGGLEGERCRTSRRNPLGPQTPGAGSALRRAEKNKPPAGSRRYKSGVPAAARNLRSSRRTPNKEPGGSAYVVVGQKSPRATRRDGVPSAQMTAVASTSTRNSGRTSLATCTNVLAGGLCVFTNSSRTSRRS